MTVLKQLIRTSIFLLFVLTVMNHSFAQKLNCADLKNITVYSYPKNTSHQSEFIRKDDEQREIDMLTGDTSVWKIKWINDCIYSLKYASGDEKASPQVKKIEADHKFIVKIESIGEGFYTYSAYLDKITSKYLVADTVWFQKKVIFSNNTLFEFIPSDSIAKIQNFDSNAKFALLYVYRPKRLAGSLGEFFLYFDDNIMCVSKNNVGYIFKVYKEGTFRFAAKLFDQKEILEDIKISFGQRFYFKANTKFVGLNTLSGWRPDLTVMDLEKGSEEFADVNVK